MEIKQNTIKNFSVVTTVFNDEREVIVLLQELERQTYQPKEVIVVDGGSKDNTVENVKKYSNGSHLYIKVLAGERLNIAQGLNKGILNAQSELIGIAMCGNHYGCDFFQRLYEDFEKEENIFVTYGVVRGVSACNWGKKYIRFMFGEKNIGYLEKFPTNHGNLARKELYDGAGLFYENFQYAGEDYEFFLRVKSQGYKTYGDSSAIIDWETPPNAKQYRKQQIGYTISNMEIFNNRAVVATYWRNGCYVLAWILCVLCLLSPKTKLISIFIGTWLLYKNIRKCLQYGIAGIELLNLVNFVPILTIIRNSKFLLRKNKIPTPLNLDS